MAWSVNLTHTSRGGIVSHETRSFFTRDAARTELATEVRGRRNSKDAQGRPRFYVVRNGRNGFYFSTAGLSTVATVAYHDENKFERQARHSFNRLLADIESVRVNQILEGA